jgi:hypothetical protein
MRLNYLGIVGAVLLAMIPVPAQAQGDFIKDKVKELIQKSGVYVSAGTRQSIDNDVQMGPSIGIGYGTASLNPRTGRKFPFSFSTFGADLQAADSEIAFGRFKSRQIMSGIGYQWVRGKMIYSTQLGIGYAFNNVTLEPGAALAFGVTQPVSVDVSNSWV